MADIKAAVTKAKNSKVNKSLRQETDQIHAEVFHSKSMDMEENNAILLTNIIVLSTRSMNKSTKSNERRVSSSTANDSSIEKISLGDRQSVITEGTLKWKIIPREPISCISDFKSWAHEGIHHQNHFKVLHVLKASYYWPNMAKDIEHWCIACPTCATTVVRRKHLKTKFDLASPQASMMPRQHYPLSI
jgi:hypothetical protein